MKKLKDIQSNTVIAKFRLGQIVKHRVYDFRGVIVDVDPEFNNSEEWLASIPEDIRPHKNQPFYHLLANNGKSTYIAYVSEQNLDPDHGQLAELGLDYPELSRHFSQSDQGDFYLSSRLLH